MKTRYLLMTLSLLACINMSLGQCGGGSSFQTVTAPTGPNPVTISTCNWAGDFNTINGVIAGTTYNLTISPAACITVHSGSPTGPVVAFGMSAVTFTATTSGTHYMTINTNCTGCGTGATCLTTTISTALPGPCGAQSIIAGCGQAFTLTTTGASSFISNLCATATPGLEQIYAYTATSTGNYSFNVTSVTGGGYVLGWKAASDGCTGTGWNCVGTVTTPGSFGSIAMVSGTTYYFVVDATSTAASSITFSLTCPAGAPTTAGDCVIAANVCSDASFAIDPNGFGLYNEICPAGSCAANPSINVNSTNPGCLISGELNSTWMIVNVLNAGTLNFQLGTPNSGNFNCLDWSMWEYTPSTCANIQAGTQAPIRCNYNGSCEGFTGLSATLPTGATSMTNWEAPVNASAYSQYLICLSNYSSAVTTVPLNFGGTAVVSCSPLGIELISLHGEDKSGYNLLTWNTTLELNLQKFVIERSSDGIYFEPIGELNAQGFSLDQQDYHFRDLNPLLGYNYYRIVGVHPNSNPLISDIIALRQEGTDKMQLIECFPNPAQEKAFVSIASPSDRICAIQISNLNGKVLAVLQEKLNQGINQLTIDLSSFEKGIYLINIIDGETKLPSERLIKL